MGLEAKNMQPIVKPAIEEWKCSNCKWHNYENAEKCYYCGTPR